MNDIVLAAIVFPVAWHTSKWLARIVPIVLLAGAAAALTEDDSNG